MESYSIRVFITFLLFILSPILCLTQNLRIENKSYKTNCAEHDNISIPIFGPLDTTIIITASHPPYDFTDDDCSTDFSGSDCNSTCPDSDYIFTPMSDKIFDDYTHVIWVYTNDKFWRPNRMKVRFNKGGTAYGNYLAVSKKLVDKNNWNQFFVLYQDSYLRLIPQPKGNLEKTCFGSSIVLGPAGNIQASGCNRPYCDIDSVLVDTVGIKSIKLNLWYHDGNTSFVTASVDTQKAIVTLKTHYSSSQPLVTFRSMWINSTNCDVDSLSYDNGKYPIISGWDSINAPWFKFFRSQSSSHNNSAPDIKIEIQDTTISSVENIPFDGAPMAFKLMQNSPNPFNPSTSIKFQLPVSSFVTIKIFDTVGREVTTLINEERMAGSHIVYWNGKDINGNLAASGVYFYKLTAGSFTKVHKMILLK